MLLTFLDRYRDFGLLVLRVGIGIMFILHGVPKLGAGPETWTMLGSSMANFGITFGHQWWGLMAALAESVGGALILLGFLFRYANAVLVINMSVAASYHLFKGDPFSMASHAVEAGILFFSLIFIGPGRFSIDELLTRRRTRTVVEEPPPGANR